MELDLENIVAIAHVIQSANGRVAGSRTVILIGQVVSAKFKDRFNVWHTVTYLCIQCMDVFNLAIGKIAYKIKIVLPFIYYTTALTIYILQWIH